MFVYLNVVKLLMFIIFKFKKKRHESAKTNEYVVILNIMSFHNYDNFDFF